MTLFEEKVFLSTPSARRATRYGQHNFAIFCQFLSTPSARRATSPRCPRGWRWCISIHALREEGDDRVFFPKGNSKISIHALREEGDQKTRIASGPRGRISIHALREEGDRAVTRFLALLALFLSTPSARRATRPPAQRAGVHDISIHALREEGDMLCRCLRSCG